MTKIAVLVALLSLSIPSVSTGDELVSIGAIASNATSLALHLVTFQGTIKELEPIPPFPTPGCVSYDRYKAVVEDETGSIDAIVCGAPVDSNGEIVKGDRVLISAVISVLNSDAAKPLVVATVTNIARVSSPHN
jgi:hypothetical protein